MPTIISTLKVIARSWAAEVAAALQYRVNFALYGALSAVWLAVPVVPILVASTRATEINGWNRGELLVIQAAWYVLDVLVWMVLLPNLGDLSNQVASGELDMILLKPVDSMVYASTRRIIPTEFTKLPLAFGLLCYGLATSGAHVTPASIVGGVIGLGAALVLFWAFFILLTFKALTAVRFDAGWLAVGAHNVARLPVSFYGRSLSMVMTVAVPIAFVTTVPSELILGRAGWRWVVFAVLAATATTAVARFAWLRQVRQYSGAMS